MSDNMEILRELWKRDDLESKNIDLRAENADLRDELAALREKNEQQAVEIGLLRERVREVAEELSDSSVTFSDPRVSYEEIQLTAGWRKEWLSYPEVVRALEEKR